MIDGLCLAEPIPCQGTHMQSIPCQQLVPCRASPGGVKKRPAAGAQRARHYTPSFVVSRADRDGPHCHQRLTARISAPLHPSHARQDVWPPPVRRLQQDCKSARACSHMAALALRRGVAPWHVVWRQSLCGRWADDAVRAMGPPKSVQPAVARGAALKGAPIDFVTRAPLLPSTHCRCTRLTRRTSPTAASTTARASSAASPPAAAS